MQHVQSYQVAGLRFTIEGDFPVLQNLEPFCSEQGEEIFRLQVVSSLLPLPTTPVYRTEDGPGFPEISIDALPDGGYRFRMRPLPGKPLEAELRTNTSFSQAQLMFLGKDHSFALNNSLMLLYTFASAVHGAWKCIPPW